jgi:hypothetical protein
MFIGHYAVALAAKKAAPRVSLGTLVLASQLIDLLWPLFLLLGIEHVRVDPGNTLMTPLDFYDYPITHSALGALCWSAIIGGVYFAARRGTRAAGIVAAAAFSHWLLDLLTHRPDLPLWPGSAAHCGLGLWNSAVGSITVEAALFTLGVWLYTRATEARDRVGSWGLWSLLATLAIIHTSNVVGPPPPSVRMIAYAGNALWLFVAWAYWVDRHRKLRLAAEAPRRVLRSAYGKE